MEKEQLIRDIKKKTYDRYKLYFDDKEMYDEDLLIKRYEIQTGKKINESSDFESDKEMYADMIIDAYLNEEF